MAKTRENARIWGAGLEGGVWTAPKGTTAPDWSSSMDAPSTPWAEFGWLGEDGPEFEQSTDSEDLKGWPGGVTIRKKTTSLARTFKFMALEETALTLGFVHPGLTFAETGARTGIFKGTVPATHDPVEVAAIFFYQDGDNLKAAVCPAASIELSSSVPHKFDEITAYEFTATVIGEYDLYVLAADGVFIADATGATAGSPGYFTPSGTLLPAGLAALSAVTASPATAWTKGQYVTLGDDSSAYWGGSAWASGVAPA